MAIITRSPARGRAAISEAPVGTYEAVAAKYANEFAQAKRQQKANEMSMKIIQWQNGELSYDELKKYLNDRIGGAKDNSSEKIELMQTLSSVGEHQKKLKEVDNQQRVANKRAELLDKYKDKGISNQEALGIVQELRKVADEDSSVYQELIAEEANVRGAIESERASAAGAAATETINQLDAQIADVFRRDNETEFDYQAKGVSGYERDIMALNHSQEINDLIAQYASTGKKIPNEYLDLATNFTNGAEKLKELREMGAIADVLNNDGTISRVFVTDNNFGQEVKFSPTGGVSYGGMADIEGVQYDPMTGDYSVQVPGEDLPQTFTNAKQAYQFAQDNEVLTLAVVMPEVIRDESGRALGEQNKVVRMKKDSKTGAFYEVSMNEFGEQVATGNVYAVIPRTTAEAENYKITLGETGTMPEDWFSNPESQNEVLNAVMGVKGEEDNIDFTINLPSMEETQQAEPTPSQNLSQRFQEKLSSDKVGDFSKDYMMSGANPVGYGVNKVGEALGQKVGELFNPRPAQAAGPQIEPRGFESKGFSMPDFKMPQFSAPSFEMPNFQMPSFQAPSFQTPSFKESVAPVMSNIKTGVSGISSKIKDFGRKAVTGVKNFLGF